MKAIREIFGREKYIWLYTNGALVDEEKIAALKEYDLDEIRFDLGARNYKLDKIKYAIGQIRNVTVEIPAIPEDFELLKDLIRELKDLGVDFLNLHQLRLTPHNFENLIKRKYAFLHGNKVTVLESELTALKLIEYGIKNNIDLPINYCSFVYKNRFQNAAARKRVAPEIMEPYESMTESGFVRQIKCFGTKEEIKALQSKIEKEESLRIKFKAISEHEFFIHPEALSMVLDETKSIQNDLSFRLTYFHVKLLSGLSYRNPFKEIRLSENKKIVVEKMQAGKAIVLDNQEIHEFNSLFLESTSDFTTYENIPKWNQVARFEWIESGLQEYF
ncbi:MAG: hypothetical protein U5Q03_16495 [Bacteroidota bacterium]|nr:hypothetical protein [Bacteroidota bacterium]